MLIGLQDYFQELDIFCQSSAGERNYEMYNGEILSLGNERFRTGEVLFRPELLGSEDRGIHLLIADWLVVGLLTVC